MAVRSVMVALGLFCLCGIMFFTGVMVGRGTAPVHFDTRSFQTKLAALSASKDKKNPPEKVALGFYKELKKKVPTDFSLADDVSEAEKRVPSHGKGTMAPDEPVGVEGAFPIKKGLKKTTRRGVSQNSIPDLEGATPGSGAKIQGAPTPSPEIPTASQSRAGYTIQIASFRNLVDAIQRMETLKTKGVMPHRSLALVGGKVWHRVRVGKFHGTRSAEKALKALEAKGIYGIIIEIR